MTGNTELSVKHLEAAMACMDENLAQALAEATKAIQADGNAGMAYYIRGTIYTNTEQYAEAVSDFDQAITLGLDRAWHRNLYTLRGGCRIALEQYQQAWHDTSAALEFPESDDDISSNAELQEQLDALAEALK
jgi:tetratricopeptide (TPR) repeat protein